MVFTCSEPIPMLLPSPNNHCHTLYAPAFPPAPQPFLGTKQFFGFPLVLSKPMIQLYRPVSFCFKTAASRQAAFTPDSSVPGTFTNISKCSFHMSGTYPPHPLPHRTDAEVMFLIVVEVFSLERIRFESQSLLYVVFLFSGRSRCCLYMHTE